MTETMTNLAAGDSTRIAEPTRRSTAVVTARVTPDSEAVGAGVILAISPNVIILTAGHLAARKNLAVRTFAGEHLRIIAEYQVADARLLAAVDVEDDGGAALRAIASEGASPKLTDAEREKVMHAVLEHVAGRVPVIVTTTHFSSAVCAARSREA